MIGAEALLRWHNHGGEDIPPNRFIPVAEQSGLIHSIGRWVIEQALAQLNRWQRSGLTLPSLAINVSGQQLAPEAEPLDQLLLGLCEHWAIPPARLEVELTETALISNPNAAARTLAALDEAGVNLAIDDFGTGYSSLSRLNHFPFHSLKVDMSFVKLHDAPKQPSNRILEVIQAIAEALDLHTTAEGVETEAQRQWLQNHGFQWGQGYLVAKPMPLQEILNLLPS